MQQCRHGFAAPRLLVIENGGLIASVTAEALNDEGYAVRTAGDGRAARQQVLAWGADGPLLWDANIRIADVIRKRSAWNSWSLRRSGSRPSSRPISIVRGTSRRTPACVLLGVPASPWCCAATGDDADGSPGGRTMFARVAWGKVRPGTWQDYEQFYHDEVLPKTRDLQGLAFRELLQGADDPNEGISLSLWESREDLEAYERSDVYAEITEHGRAFYIGEFWVKHFDVRLGEELKRVQTAADPQEGLGGWQSAAEAGSPESRPK